MTLALLASAWLISAYGYGCDCVPGNRTKAGTLPVSGHTVAADPRVLPIGSIVHIEGLGERQVHDVGSAVKGRHIDVYFDSCAEARRWGKQWRKVKVLHRPTHYPGGDIR